MQKLYKILKKTIGILILIALIVVAFAFSYFYMNKDDIASKLLSNYNNQIQGKIYFKDISIEPFVHFPSISFALEDFRLYENSEEDNSILNDPIAEFENVYFAIDLVDFLEDVITITRISLEEGYVDLVKYKNKKYNFQVALGEKRQDKKKVKIKRKRRKKSAKKKESKEVFIQNMPQISKTIKLNLNELSISNTHLEFNNQKNGNQINQFFHTLKAYLSIMPDSIITSIYSKSVLKELPLGKDFKLQDVDYTLNTTLRISRHDSIAQIEPSQLILSKAKFNLNGFFDVKENGLLDLEINGTDKGLGFVSYLLSKKGLENVKNGNLFFNGHINGTFKDEIPNVQFDFGLRDLSMGLPESTDSLINLKVIGRFKSGRKVDLSETRIQVDTLQGQLPEGFIEGDFIAENFTEPYLDYKIKLKTRVNNLDKVIRQNLIDSLTGKIELIDEFEGVLNPKLGWNDKKKGNLLLKFDSISFKINESLKITHFEGNITDKNNSVQLNEIKLRTDSSDLMINGSVKNLPNLFFDEGKKIIVDLKLKTTKLNFSDFQNAEGTTQQDANFVLKNSKFRIVAKTTKKEFTEDKQFPIVHIKIKPSRFTISGFTNPLNIVSGSFVTKKKKSTHVISMNNLVVKSESGKIMINATKRYDDKLTSNISFKFKTTDFIPSEYILNVNKNDLSNQKYNSVAHCDFIFQNRDQPQVENFLFQIEKAFFTNNENKFKFENIKLSAKRFDLEEVEGNFPSRINGNFKFYIERLERNKLKLSKKQYEIIAEKGVFTVSPQTDSLFNAKVKGEIILSPFTQPGRYSLKLNMHGICLGPVQTSLFSDSLMSGKVNAQLHLSFSGLQKDSVINSLRGEIKVRGKNIDLRGFDLDEFLNNYKENQELDLTNIGLKFYQGPINWLGTKSQKSASLKVTNRKTTSLIKQLMLDWEINSDTIFTKDVALTTPQNRLALKGFYRFLSDSLNFDIGLLDDKSYSLIEHKIKGIVKKPEIQNFNLFELQKKKSAKNCPPFYTGRLEHPVD